MFFIRMFLADNQVHMQPKIDSWVAKTILDHPTFIPRTILSSLRFIENTNFFKDENKYFSDLFPFTEVKD